MMTYQNGTTYFPNKKSFREKASKESCSQSPLLIHSSSRRCAPIAKPKSSWFVRDFHLVWDFFFFFGLHDGQERYAHNNWDRFSFFSSLQLTLLHSQIAYHFRPSHLNGHDWLLSNDGQAANTSTAQHAEIRSCRQEKSALPRSNEAWEEQMKFFALSGFVSVARMHWNWNAVKISSQGMLPPSAGNETSQ